MIRLTTLFLATFLLSGCIAGSEGTGPTTNELAERLDALEEGSLVLRVALLEEEGVSARVDQANLDERVTSIEDLELVDRLGTHETDLDILDDNLTILGTALAAHEAAIAINNTGRVDNSTDIASLQGELGALETQTLQIDAGLLAVQGEATQLGSDLAALEVEVDANVPIRTTLSYSGQTTGTVSNTFTELRSIGTFTKQYAATDIRLVWLSQAGGDGTSTFSSACNFQPRVDGSEGGNGYGAVVSSMGEEMPVTVVQTYSGLAAGSHTVTLWARHSPWTGSCFDNLGDYTRKVYIEESPAN